MGGENEFLDDDLTNVYFNNAEGDILWSMGVTAIDTGMSHNTFDLGAGVFGSTLILDIDLTGLGFSSDNIAIVDFTGRQKKGVEYPSEVIDALDVISGVTGQLISNRTTN